MLTNGCGKVQFPVNQNIICENRHLCGIVKTMSPLENMTPQTKLPLVVPKPSHFKECALTTVLLFGGIGLAYCDTIVSSLSSNTLQSAAFTPGGWAASSFQMGNQQFVLTNVTLSMAQGGQTSSMADVQVFANVVADGTNRPGVSLVDLGVQEITGFQSRLWSFTVTNGLLLDAFNTYWVGVGNVSPDAGLNVDVVQGGTFTFTGQPLTMMPFSGASGMSSGMNAPVFLLPGAGGALPFQADGTGGAVPEPGSLGLLAMGIVGLFVTNRWKSRSAR